MLLCFGDNGFGNTKPTRDQEHSIDATTQPSRPHPRHFRRPLLGGQCRANPSFHLGAPLGPAPTRRAVPRPGQCPGPGEPGRQDDDAGGFRPDRRRSRLHAPHPPFRRRPVRWIWAKNSGEYGRWRTSVRRAINGSSSPRGRNTAQESLLRWRRKLELGWRRELPTKLIYVTVTMRITVGINKAEDAGGWMPKSGSPMRCGGLP